MENLNVEQVKKALEFCKSPKLTKCYGCPRENEDGQCMYRLNEDALALINSQEQRIKELTEENEYLKTQVVATEARYESRKESDLEEVLRLRIEVEELTEKNERLSKEVADLQDEHKCEKETNEHLCGEYMSAKADTVRKMHSEIKERCIKGGIYPAFVATTIDQIAKEMLEGEK